MSEHAPITEEHRNLAYALSSHFNGIYCDEAGLQLLADHDAEARREVLEEALAAISEWLSQFEEARAAIRALAQQKGTKP